MKYLITSYKDEEQKEIIRGKNLYCYDLRLNEEGNKIEAIEEDVEYDRAGSLITDEKLKFPHTKYFIDDIDFKKFASKNEEVKEMPQLDAEEQEIEKAVFYTKIASEMKHNGEIVDVLDLSEGKDSSFDRYVVRFNDNTISNNIMPIELEFDYTQSAIHNEYKTDDLDIDL